MPSSLITSIDYVIMRNSENYELKIGLRTLKVFLLLRKSELKVELINLKLSILSRKWDGYGERPKPSSLLSLFLRIRRLIFEKETGSEKMLNEVHSLESILFPVWDRMNHITVWNRMKSEKLNEVHSLEKEADLAFLNRMSHSSLLTVDEILRVAHAITDSAVDSLKLLVDQRAGETNDSLLVIEAFRVHMVIMRNFLQFAEQTGVELENVLFHIKPIAINAARVFIKDGASDWCRDVESYCLAVNRMAADPQVYQAYSQALAAASAVLSVTPSQVDYGVLKNFLDSLISILWDVLRPQSHSYSRSKHQFTELYKRLRFCRDILKKYAKDEKIVVQIRVLVCDAGVFIYSHYQPDHEQLSGLLQRFHVLEAQVKADEELISGAFQNMKIYDGSDTKDLDIPTPIWNHQPPQSSITSVVGFHPDEVNSVLNRLIRGSKQLRIVQIYGMAGIGKTTFALQLYNHVCVEHHFHACAWYAISQRFDKKKALLQLLNQIHKSESHSKMSEYDLTDRLRKNLKGKRYLILLDDVWTPDVWNSLEASFPDDSTGSRIILTSRNLGIVDSAWLDGEPHLLRLREENECLEILKAKLVLKQGWNLDIGMRIAKMCKGLPLTLGILAGVLATSEEEAWKGILDRFSSGDVSGALELSYAHLPDYLQPCFLYFGACQEDRDIYVRWLIHLWMGEGFVREDDLRIEDVARRYMEMLIERSLVMVVESRSIGGVKTCRIHDLVLEFCQIKAKKESLFHLLQQSNDELSGFNEPCNLQRLVIYSDPVHFKESGLLCPNAQSILFFQTEDSLLFDMSFVIQIFQQVKVLDIGHLYMENEIPSEIGRLTQLRYLALSSTVPVIPSSIGNLFNLEFFIALFFTRTPAAKPTQVSFPHTLWNLRKLKCLRIYSTGGYGCTLPTEDLENPSSLLELETLRGVVFCCDDGSMEKLLRKVPNVRRLKCVIPPSEQSSEVSNKIVVPEFPSQLESLTISGTYQVKCAFSPSNSASLRKLKMVGFELSKEEIAVIGKLPNLEVLKLHDVHFPDNILDMEEEGFPELRILELGDLSHTLERWTASEDQLPCLVKLVFKNCTVLKEIPCCLESIPTLEEIQVYRCSSTLESLVRDVKEVRADSGNLTKVHITSQ